MDKAAAVLEGLNAYDVRVKEIDNFIDGVESGIKEAGFNHEQAARVWSIIGDVLEKSAVEAPITANPASLTMTPEQQMTPGVNPNIAESPVTSDMTAPATPAAPAPAAPAPGLWDRIKGHMANVDWKSPNTWGRAALGGGVGALGGLLGTALMSQPDEEGRKPYLRNALMGLAGGAGLGAYAMPPETMSKLVAGAKPMATKAIGKVQSGMNTLADKAKTQLGKI